MTARTSGKIPPLLTISLVHLPGIHHGAARALWVDVAKGVSIILVVLWHTIGDFYKLNEALIFLRMPLFFFAAGLFARRNFAGGEEARPFNKIFNFLWLFMIWSVILFVATEVPGRLWAGESVLDHVLRLPLIFVDPPLTIWFIYALAISFALIFALRTIPISIILLISVAIFILSANDGNWRQVFFLERIFRLLPFFVLGLITFPLMNFMANHYARTGPVFLLIFGSSAYYVYFSEMVYMGSLVFAVSVLGIFAVVLTSSAISGSPAGILLAKVGSASLFIYLMHRIFIFYFNMSARLAGLDFRSSDLVFLAAGIVLSIASIAASMIIGRTLERSPAGRWLFNSPLRMRARAE